MTLPIKEIILAPGQGNHLQTGNSEVIFKAVGADTHGHLGLSNLRKKTLATVADLAAR
ncbi:hypothetical protein [Anabaena azotica]|uniref:Uncharacterized protein n=1 Tax=Anabaena azotica FACHB-119 TaxID=947527 RepID=A0ABR8D6R4_9NOST|nr:hypothetical protein [Anabaena azotica]MBD2502636.1 hypothetical protein [Anabaena azotica FACHB-119]